MLSVVQRVSAAEVRISGRSVVTIRHGLMILLGVHADDTETDARWSAEKCANLRIFENEEGKFDRSLLDVGGEALVVSQFTLYGDTRRGRRPSFTEAAPTEIAEPLYRSFVESLRGLGIRVATGEFGAKMEVIIHNQGPVTVLVESRASDETGNS